MQGKVDRQEAREKQSSRRVNKAHGNCFVWLLVKMVVPLCLCFLSGQLADTHVTFTEASSLMSANS